MSANIVRQGTFKVIDTDTNEVIGSHNEITNAIETLLNERLNNPSRNLEMEPATYRLDLNIDDILQASYDAGYEAGLNISPTDPPVETGITVVLNGEPNVTVGVDEVYTELGARVTTDAGPPFTWQDLDITVTGVADIPDPVSEGDETTETIYEIIYTATDDLGNTATATRTVTVFRYAGGGGTEVGELPKDTTPDQFFFVDQNDVQLNTQITSAPITVTGITLGEVIPISISGHASSEFSVNSTVNYQSTPSTVQLGDQVRVRHQSSITNNDPRDTTANINGVSDTFTSTTVSSGVVVAFPGAQGFGTQTIGGRGGTVIHVTTLAGSGAGSFREAVETAGPRIIVFDVSGYIDLGASALFVSDPFLTIAGQTSPSGICIVGNRFRVQTHDVIIRHVRFRIGQTGDVAFNKSRAFELDGVSGNAVYNVVCDHCTFSYGIDTNVTTADDTNDCTFSWCLNEYGQNHSSNSESDHALGWLFWGKNATYPNTYSYHHNATLLCQGRTPEMNFSGEFDARNNVCYGYLGNKSPKTEVTSDTYSFLVNWIHNYTNPAFGPSTDFFEVRHSAGSETPNNQIYAEGNLGVKRTSQSDPEWDAVGGSGSSPLSTSYQAVSPFATPSGENADVTTTTMSAAYAETILQTVGAYKTSVDGDNRDSVDADAVTHYLNGTGTIQGGRTTGVSISYPDATWYPDLGNSTPLTDTDGDGIPDSYSATGWNPPTTTANDTAPSGYTWIEEYINSLA